MFESIGAQAFFWGAVSAVSLPLGAALGLWLKPKQKINSSFMAFGAGALLFALTIELFGHLPQHVKEHGMSAMGATFVGAILGGLLFDFLNKLLNDRGAFLRKFSIAKRHVAKIKLRRSKKLIEHLGKIEVMRSIPPEKIANLLHRVKEQKFKAGSTIFKTGDSAHEMFFIISGEVEVVVHQDSGDKKIATLGANETFGEMGILNEQARMADIVVKSDLIVYVIEKVDFDDIINELPELKAKLSELSNKRLDELVVKTNLLESLNWAKKAGNSLDDNYVSVSEEEIAREADKTIQVAGGSAAMAIWMGIFIDGIPESLVIGMLSISASGMSISFIAGVFLANMPEAMSSSVSMRKSGMKVSKILLMWGSLTVMMGVGAYIGATMFPTEPAGTLFLFILGIEGLAAGAMLTMIAETMLPEAFEQGGSVVGMSTLFGFLAALAVKVSF